MLKSGANLIKLNFNNSLLERTICDVLFSKNLLFTKDENEKYFTLIKISEDVSTLSIKMNNENINLKKPMNFDLFFQGLHQLLLKYKIDLNDIIFFPFQQKLIFKNKKLFLNDIHNKLFCYLYLYKDEGIDKFFIYKKIWPQDKEIFINKLDSHLSNVKNEIKTNLSYNFDYSSKKKLIKLIIN